MSWKCEVKRITDIQPIHNADKIELLLLGGWPVVTQKGKYKVGDLVGYMPADSIIPAPLLERMGLTNKLAGSLKNRVKPVRLRGQLSIGLVYPPPDNLVEGDSIAEFYGITKYEPPIPIELAGQLTKLPDGFIKYDIDNINDRLSDFTYDEPCFAFTKIHGSCGSACLINGEFKVNSRNCSLVESDTNTYWQAVRNHGLREKIKEGLWIYWELVPTQKFKYGLNKPTLFVFDIKDEGGYWSVEKMMEFCKNNNLPTAPLVYSGPFDMGMLKTLAGGFENISGNKLHINEGIVVRPRVERYNSRGERVIAKMINPEYSGGDWDDQKTGG